MVKFVMSRERQVPVSKILSHVLNVTFCVSRFLVVLVLVVCGFSMLVTSIFTPVRPMPHVRKQDGMGYPPRGSYCLAWCYLNDRFDAGWAHAYLKYGTARYDKQFPSSFVCMKYGRHLMISLQKVIHTGYG